MTQCWTLNLTECAAGLSEPVSDTSDFHTASLGGCLKENMGKKEYESKKESKRCSIRSVYSTRTSSLSASFYKNTTE